MMPSEAEPPGAPNENRSPQQLDDRSSTRYSSVVDEPVDAQTLRQILLSALSGGEVRFSRHGLDEMGKDGLVERDCVNVLRGGVLDGCDFEQGSWRYRVRTPKIVVVVGLRAADAVVVVTAWRER